jgi:ABC-type Mn2+/Zn2+ transport system ATPase subunit
MKKELPIIELENIKIIDNKNGQKNGKVLLMINEKLTFNPGDIIVIRGNNGTGKSVFLKYITRNLDDFFVSKINKKSTQIFRPFIDSPEETINFPSKPSFPLFSEYEEKVFLNTVSAFLGKENNAPKNYNLSQTLEYLTHNKNNQILLKNKRLIKTYLAKQFSLDTKQEMSNSEMNKWFNKKLKNEITPKIDGNYINRYRPFLFKDTFETSKDSKLIKFIKSLKIFNILLPKTHYNKENFNTIPNRYLSGGQSQALYLYQTMLFSELVQASVTVLDEPLNFLDYQNRQNMVKEIQNFIFDKSRSNQKGIVFIVSHQASLHDNDFRFIPPSEKSLSLIEIKRNIAKITNSMAKLKQNKTKEYHQELFLLAQQLSLFEAFQQHEDFIHKNGKNRKVRIFEINKEKIVEIQSS